MKYLLTVVFILASSFSAFAHSSAEIEKELIGLLDEIEKYSNYSGGFSSEKGQKLSAANIEFRKRLLATTSQHDSLLNYDFPELGKRIRIEASPDKNLKIYSWDTMTGGSMHMYDNVYQFRGASGVSSTGTFHAEGDAQSFVNGISNIKTKTGTIYLVSSTAVLSSSYRWQALKAFQINGNNLVNSVKIIKTRTRITNTVGFAYDFFTIADRVERPVRLFEYDDSRKTITFPVVIEDKKTPQGRVTSSMIVYKYNGKYFIRVKN